MAVYVFFGTSQFVSIAPVSILSLLTAATLLKLDISAPDESVLYATAMALLVGIFTILLGWLRGAKIVSFISPIVMLGFISGAAVVIGVAQLDSLFGIRNLKKNGNTMLVAYRICEKLVLGEFDMYAAKIGLLSLFLLVTLHALSPRYKFIQAIPKPLFVMTVMTAVSWFAFTYYNWRIPVVGEVPSGLPAFASPLRLELSKFAPLVLPSLAMTVLGYLETMSVSQKYAEDQAYELDLKQEFFALGISNFVGSFFGCYAVAGGISRSAVNRHNGASSLLSGTFTVLVLTTSLTPLVTPLIYYIPKATLAAIILIAVIGLIEVDEAYRIWKLAFMSKKYEKLANSSTSVMGSTTLCYLRKYTDFAVGLSTFLFTIFLNLEVGIFFGMGTSILLLFIGSSDILSNFGTYDDCAVLLGQIRTSTSTVLGTEDVIGSNRVEGSWAVASAGTICSGEVMICRYSQKSLSFIHGPPLLARIRDLLISWREYAPETYLMHRGESSSTIVNERAPLLSSRDPKYLILDVSEIIHVDISGLEALAKLPKVITSESSVSVRVLFVGAKPAVFAMMTSFFSSSHDKSQIVIIERDDPEVGLMVEVDEGNRPYFIFGFKSIETAFYWVVKNTKDI
ncbi:hypothetical protein HK098_007430 [Nowakowskiella sp. JEL0407]|nr:hypothetical protein HK098_007430 [Nowakowskiella sp. JEL0407]